MESLPRILSMLALILVVWEGSSLAQDFRRIIPLQTTRTEVEKLLGLDEKSSGEKSYAAIYHLNDGVLFIQYSSGPCRPNVEGGWNVPIDTVIQYSFSPKVRKRLSELKLNLKKYRKIPDLHVPGVFYYVNDDGTTYNVHFGKVDAIEYGPPKSQQHLSCDDKKKTLVSVI
jgi:hypothetical protein